MLTIPLPESYLDAEVHVTVRIEERSEELPKKKKTISELVESLSGILAGHTEEELYEARDQYLIEKYIHEKRPD